MKRILAHFLACLAVAGFWGLLALLLTTGG